LLTESKLWFRGSSQRDAGGSNIDINASAVVLVLALGIIGVNTACSRVPLPHPVEGVWFTRGSSLGKLYVGIAKEWKVAWPRIGLSHSVVGGNLDTLLVYGRLVVLVAASVIEVVCGQQDTTSVSAFAILGPTENTRDLLVLLGLGGAVHEDCTSLLRLALLVAGQGDVAVLHVAHCDVSTWSRLKARIFVRRLFMLSLLLVAK
jgi:hypothetical protein